MRKRIWERIVPLSKAQRDWDIEFWQAQGPSARFKTAFDMLRGFYRLKGKKINTHAFRLQRSVERIRINPIYLKELIKSKEKNKKGYGYYGCKELKICLKERN